MNFKTTLPLLACFAYNTVFSQTIVRVDPAQNGAPSPYLYQKGVFSNPRNTAGENIFYSIGSTPFGMLRDHSIEYQMMTSTSMSDCFARVAGTQAYHIDKDQRANKLNLLIAGTPKWLSSSTDTTLFEGTWRAYHTKRPANYVLWDSLVRGIVSIVKGWGISPYYEVWNEPDGGYWTGTTGELLELYKHTAIAVKQADPNAKVGGLAPANWSTGVGGVGATPQNFGYLPDASVNQVSLLADLIDSAAVWGSSVPLDFISWHWFSIYPSEISRAETFFKNKIAGYGMNPIPFLITEWNTTTSSRETPFQGPQMLRNYDKFCEGGGIIGQAVSVFQDWAYTTPIEFYQSYGMISINGLIKPAFKCLLLLDYLQMGADTISVTESSPLVSFASIKSDTVKIVLSNYAYWPFYAGLEELLYNHPFNQIDLVNAGYNTNVAGSNPPTPFAPGGKLDSTFYGLQPPQGPAALVNAINAAKVFYAQHLTNLTSHRNVSLRLKNQTGLKNGRMFLVDSTHNNIIHKYDSMLLAGDTRADAVAALYPAQAFTFSTIQITDSVFNFSMQPNATVLLEFYNVSTATSLAENTQDNFMSAYPNPFTRFTTLKIKDGINLQNAELSIYDIFGKEVKHINNISSKEIMIDGNDLAQGVYVYMLKNAEEIIGRGKLVKE